MIITDFSIWGCDKNIKKLKFTFHMVQKLKTEHIYENLQNNLHVIHEFSSNHDTSDEQAMNIEGIDRQRRLFLCEPVQINISNNETRRTTICILENSLKIALNSDCWASEAMEDRDLLGLETTVNVVGFSYPL